MGATESGVVKPVSSDLMEDAGTGLDYGTRPDRMPGMLTPVDRFFVRSHSPTPSIDVAGWALHIGGDAAGRPASVGYDELCHRFPQVSIERTLECAGNRRVLFGEELGTTFDGTQWGRGAISSAEWTGVRLRDLLAGVGVAADAVDVLAVSLDSAGARRPLPIAKAMADDTIVATAMNGETLPPDHGFPARLVVSGWLGAASIKWLGRLEVSRERIFVPWNTDDYVLIGPGHEADGPGRGSVITALGVSSLIELPWPARLSPGPQVIRGRAFAGENSVAAVDYRVDGGPWHAADITSATTPGLWARWEFAWNAEPGDHVISVRAADSSNNVQPEHTSFNELGYMHESVLQHPVHVSSAP